MKKLKRNLCVVIAAMMCIFMLIPSVSAASVFDKASAVEGGKKYSFSLSKKKEQVCFKIDIAEKGDLVFKVNSDSEWTNVHVYNSDYSEIDYDDLDVTSGKYDSSWDTVRYDSKTKKAVAKYTYPVKKGTYYIQFICPSLSTMSKYSYGKYSLSIISPNGDSASVKENKSETSDNTVKISLAVGDKISLGAMTDGKDCASAKWCTSDKNIAKVSAKGQVTAVKEGTCKITWKDGSKSFSVYINVTK